MLSLTQPRKRQRRVGRRQRNNVSLEESASRQQSVLSPSCDPLLKECINRVRHQTNIDLARKGITDLYGRHNAIEYRPQYQFQQSWQSTSPVSKLQNKHESYSYLSKQRSWYSIPLEIILTLGYGLTLWSLSIYRVFQLKEIVPYMAIGILILVIVGIFIEESYGCLEKSQKTNNFNQQNEQLQSHLEKCNKTINQLQTQGRLLLFTKIKIYWESLFLILYLIFLCLDAAFIQVDILFLIIFDFAAIVKIYRDLRKVYRRVKIKVLSSSWKNQGEIIQLIGGCLILLHVFSIVLFLASKADSELNWTISIERFDLSWSSRYVYSLYFACSTMFTVGYGDVTPKNQTEILTILVVQVVGIINIGYVINEVGRFMQIINEGQDRLNRNISDAEKLAENYRLPEQLTGRLRSYLISNQIASNRFNVEQEEAFMKKLSEGVREEVVSYSQLQLVKNSVFFLCHWTKRFQRSIATKLLKQLYSPNEVLPQSYGAEKLYVLFRGKIDVEANFDRSFRRKSLKVLEVNEQRDVQFNVYGYSALISGMRINLRAVAKDYSICYVIDKEGFLEALAESPRDFEYFHEIRSRVEESSCKEVWEAPSIRNGRQHYLPNHYFIIKRERSSKARNSRNSRSDALRTRKKGLFVIQAESYPTEQQIQEPSLQDPSASTEYKIKEIKVNDISQFKLGSTDSVTSIKVVTIPSSMRKVNVSQKWTKSQKMAIIFKQKVLSQMFEHLMSFGGFRVKFNFEKMIYKYNWICCKDVENRTELSLMTSRGFESVPEEGKLKLLNSKTF